MTHNSDAKEDRLEDARRKANKIVAAFDCVPVELTGSIHAWRHGGGRDLSRLVEGARSD